MNRTFYWVLFFAGLLVALAAASLERVPGYMDAEYYYAGAQRLVSGQGASEPYLWNYLNDPGNLPAPAFSYWMPLVSLVASAGLALAKPLGFLGARLGFVLLAACIPPLTARLSFQLTGQSTHARLAGLLALFPGFYLAYLPTTDAFAQYMVLGGLFLLLFSGGPRLPRWPTEANLFLLGLLAGLMHLTRADGLLWLVGAGLVVLAWFWVGRRALRWQQLFLYGGAVLGGYILVMAPWYIRNLSVWGGLFPPGGGRAMWITRYEETMMYPASLLTPQHWLAAGWGEHMRAWRDALGNNLGTILAVQGSIVLIPFILIGMWKLRGCAPVRLGAAMWAITLAVMTFAFPFAGANGGFFHSGAALQPLLWALAPVGLDRAAQGYARLRRLQSSRSMFTFLSALVVLTSVVLTGTLYFQRVVGNGQNGLAWESSTRHYEQVEQALVGQGSRAGEAVIVNNPPGYYLVSGRPAIVVPFGGVDMLLSAARRYNAHYLVLEVRNPWQLVDIYTMRAVPPQLQYLTSVRDTHLYRINLTK